jgi:hypothetical protein
MYAGLRIQMQPGANADGASSIELSEQEQKQVKEQHEDAEKKLRDAAKSLNEANSNERKQESLREVHRQAMRMLTYGVYLDRSADEPLNLMKELLGDNPSSQPDVSIVETLNSGETTDVFRKLASSEFLQNVSSDEESQIRDIASSMVRVATANTAVLIAGLGYDDEPIPDDAVIGQYSLEQLFFFLHMVDRIGFRDCTIDNRRAFMDELVSHVVGHLGQALESEVDPARFAQYFADTYNARQAEYYSYENTARSRGGTVKKTLLWEYGKRMAGLVSPRKDALRVVLIENLAMEYLGDLMPFVRKAVSA